MFRASWAVRLVTVPLRPNRGFKFWVYPRERRLVNRQWDTHKHPRDYCTKYRVNKRLENMFRASCARGLDH